MGRAFVRLVVKVSSKTRWPKPTVCNVRTELMRRLLAPRFVTCAQRVPGAVEPSRVLCVKPVNIRTAAVVLPVSNAELVSSRRTQAPIDVFRAAKARSPLITALPFATTALRVLSKPFQAKVSASGVRWDRILLLRGRVSARRVRSVPLATVCNPVRNVILALSSHFLASLSASVVIPAISKTPEANLSANVVVLANSPRPTSHRHVVTVLRVHSSLWMAVLRVCLARLDPILLVRVLRRVWSVRPAKRVTEVIFAAAVTRATTLILPSFQFARSASLVDIQLLALWSALDATCVVRPLIQGWRRAYHVLMEPTLAMIAPSVFALKVSMAPLLTSAASRPFLVCLALEEPCVIAPV